MTNTPIQVTTDLSQILNQINQKLDNIQQDVSELKQKDIPDLKLAQTKNETELKRVEEIVSSKIDGMSKRLDDTNTQIVQLQTRINGQTNWFIGIFSILVTGLLGIFGKIAFFPNP